MSPKPPVRRCAVYTRKSSEEGLEQDFNSLHAQREACEAFVRSQQGEGWRLNKDAYDDGGVSGGTMDRPALQRLLANIAQGRIDVVLVYKVDRLTRSLTDFAKIVELFDRHQVSFVSITQQFNTTTSMGRLTLNILLSFAQFEREVTGERIRDKIAASKKKGMWMGGLPPLGYDARDRKLVINPDEAERVRLIFRRYQGLGSVRQLKQELDREGIRAKLRSNANGRSMGGGPFSRGALYGLLANPIYIGQVRHKGVCHPGQHEAIIDPSLFDAVRRQLRTSGPEREGSPGRPLASLLVGKLFDDHGQRLTPSHTAKKNGRRYRYYVSQGLVTGSIKKGHGWRLPAREIEEAVVTAMSRLIADRGVLATMVRKAGIPPGEVVRYLDAGAILAEGLRSETERPTALARVLERVTLTPEGILLSISLDALGGDTAKPALDGRVATQLVPLQMKRRGVEMRMVIEGSSSPSASADPCLAKAVARARRWFLQLASGTAASTSEIATLEQVTRRYVNRLLPLALLAPQIIEAIAKGTQPADLTAQRLTYLDPPLRWSAQLEILGFTHAERLPAA